MAQSVRSFTAKLRSQLNHIDNKAPTDKTFVVKYKKKNEASKQGGLNMLHIPLQTERSEATKL